MSVTYQSETVSVQVSPLHQGMALTRLGLLYLENSLSTLWQKVKVNQCHPGWRPHSSLWARNSESAPSDPFIPLFFTHPLASSSLGLCPGWVNGGTRRPWDAQVLNPGPCTELCPVTCCLLEMAGHTTVCIFVPSKTPASLHGRTSWEELQAPRSNMVIRAQKGELQASLEMVAGGLAGWVDPGRRIRRSGVWSQLCH